MSTKPDTSGIDASQAPVAEATHPHELSLEQAQAAGACAHAGACGHSHEAEGCGHDHGAGCGHDHSHAHGEGCGYAHGEDGHEHGHACGHAAQCGHAQPMEQTDATPVYELIGGESGVRQLVDRFYDLMDLDPEFNALRAIHPTTLDGSRDKLYWFLSGWMGGPNLFADKVGAPMLRARHFPYAIGNTERDQWLICMGRAMIEVGIEEPLFDRLLRGFYETADWMRNRAG